MENHHKALKVELETMRANHARISDALSEHQQRLSSTTDDLFATHEKHTRLGLSYQSLKSSFELLQASERQSREQYESVTKDQRGHTELLANLHSIQNNLEKAEFETKARLGSQVQALDREVSLLKDQLHAEEERRNRMMDAYETQVSGGWEKSLRIRSTVPGVEEWTIE